MDAVMAAERRLGYVPRDVSAEKLGYDIESAVPGTGRLRFIEVKGRADGAAVNPRLTREIPQHSPPANPDPRRPLQS